MSATIKNCRECLMFLAVNKNKQIEKVILKKCDNSVIDAISEIALNAKEGYINYPEDIKRELIKRKHVIYKLASPSVSSKSKRNIIQKGKGILAFLLPIALQFALGEIIKRVKNA
jgi:hypothetical protein